MCRGNSRKVSGGGAIFPVPDSKAAEAYQFLNFLQPTSVREGASQRPILMSRATRGGWPGAGIREHAVMESEDVAANAPDFARLE